jgi:hypothetical protein
MNPNNNPEKLEAAIQRALRSIPDRQAPSRLEGRVLLELNRRAALPWWRKSFAYWPNSVRAVFFVGSAAAAAVVVVGVVQLGVTSGTSQLVTGFVDRFAWVATSRNIAEAIGTKFLLVISAIPPVWLYSAAGSVAFCYAALGALGAAFYRTLSFGRTSA